MKLQSSIKALKAKLAEITNWGVNEHTHRDDVRYVRFTNVVALLTISGLLVYVMSSLLRGDHLVASLQLTDLVLVTIVLALNHDGRNTAARIAFLLLVNLFILMNSCLIGHQSQVHDFFYLTCALPFLVFRVKDYKHIIAGCIMSILFFYTYRQIYPAFTAYNLELSSQLGIYEINSWMKFVWFGLSIYILAYYNFSSEKELEESNTQLNEKAAQLKRSNEDLEQFAYIISHDLKAPVRNLSSFMGLLLSRYKDELKPDAKEFVQLSKTSAERLVKQIEDLLSYSRVDRNLPPAQEVNLNDMVQTIQMELGQKIAESKATVVIDGQLPVLKDVHASMLHHVFQNLIANGIKFNKNEAPEVRISYTREADMVKFSVADNGIGIQAGFESKLFQMFKRLHTADQFEGTGIGLAVCKKILHFYKGTIWYESEAGKGTTFHFTLPDSLVTNATDKKAIYYRAEAVSTPISTLHKRVA